MAVMWNENLDREFVAMRLARKPVADMAAHFGTTIGAIYAHGRVIKCLVQDHKPMTPAERATLKELALAGTSDSDLAAAFGRTVGSIRWNLEQLGLIGDRPHRWEEADYARLRHLVEVEHKTMAELQTALDLSATTLHKHLARMGIKPPRAPRVVKPGRSRAKPPRPLRVIEPLSSDQVEFVQGNLGKLSLRALAAEVGVDVKTLKLRAAAARLSITISVRRKGEPLTREVLLALAAEGLTLTEAGRRLGRDYRTMAAATASHGVAFPTRAAKMVGVRQAKAAQTMAARQATAEKRQAEAEMARAERVAERRASHVAAAAPHMAAHGAGALRKAPLVAKAAPRMAAPSKALHEVAAQKPAARRAEAPAAPVANRQTARPAADRQAARPTVARPVVVRVLEAPAAPRPPAPAPAETKPARRWNMGPLNSGKPKFALVQSEVDAAVARFIAERGVTRPAADPVEAAIMEARRMGFQVLRDGDGFVLDGRIRLASAGALQDWVASRMGGRLQMTA